MIKNKVLFGTGIGNYIETLKENNSKNPAWTYQPVHDVPLLMWAETGIVGLLAMVAFLVALWLYVWRSKNIVGLALLAALVPALALDHWLWSLHFGIMFVGFIFGIIVNRSFEKA